MLSAHKKSLNGDLSAGLARGHRGNPAASLHVHQLYATPVLFSGMASLVLSPTEIKMLDNHFQNTLQDLQCLHPKTPRSVVLLMAGSLPGEGILHIKQLTHFAMICRLPSDPLNTHARHVLTVSSPSAKSWFQQVRDICLKYSLPHPLHLLDNPPTKSGFKKLVKMNVKNYWESLLRSEAMELSSLQFFQPYQYSLKQPSLIWLSAGSSSFECTKSMIVARMISGRYRSEELCRHWSASNKLGYCLADTCSGVVGDLAHILVVCPALQAVRNRLRNLWLDRTSQIPALYNLIQMVLSFPPPVQVQFILEPGLFPGIVMLWETFGQPLLDHVYYLTRTYAYQVHREKLISLGRWPGDPGRRQRPVALSNNLQTNIRPTFDMTLPNHDNNFTNFSLIPGLSGMNPDADPAGTVHITTGCSHKTDMAKLGNFASVGPMSLQTICNL